MNKEQEKRPIAFTLEEIVRIAKEVALQHGGHVPTLIAEGNKRAFGGQIANLPETHEDRVRWMHSAGYALAQSEEVGDLRQVFFISEGWMIVGEEDGPPASRPSQDPRRKEVLVISNRSTREQESRLVIFEMVRDVEGKLAELKDIQLPGENEERHAETPLLDAFVDGFRMGLIDHGDVML
jgi:hypothetical protein